MNMKSYALATKINNGSLNIKSNNNTVATRIQNYVDDYSSNHSTSNEVENINLDVGEVVGIGLDLAIWILNGIPATRSLLVGKIRAGAWDVMEKVGDGFLNIGSVLIEKDAIISSRLWGQINKRMGENIYDTGMSIRNWLRDDISINYVDGLEKEFFENTNVGSNMNNNSFIKYDSNIAEITEAGSKFFSEAAAATGITFVTGGFGAASIAVAGGSGFVEHYGDQGEKHYQKSFDLTNAEESGMVFSGITGALDWIFKQRAGLGVVNFVGTLGASTSSAALGSSSNTMEAMRTLASTNRKRGLAAYLSSMGLAILRPESLIDISNGVMSDVSRSLNNNKDINYAEVGTNALWNGAKNAIFGGIGTYAGSLRTASFESIDSKIISLLSIGGETGDSIDDATPDVFSPYQFIVKLRTKLSSKNN